MLRICNSLANLFPVWVLLCSGLALYFPPWFTWFTGPMIVWGLSIIMLGMGITLTFDDFHRVAKMPRIIIAGTVAHFGIMPFLGWSIAHGLALEPELAVGLILVACCPCGTASNVVSYIARADVALSVLLTMVSTFTAVVMTPLLVKLLAGAYTPVDGWGIFLNTLQVIVMPVTAGLLLNRYAPRLVRTVSPVTPLVSVIFIAFICANIIGANADVIKSAALKLFGAVALLHVGGFGLGYVFARVLGYRDAVVRTIAIEVGMQNSGLATVLAKANFAGMALAPIPSAISASFHSIIGSLLAGWWRLRTHRPLPSMGHAFDTPMPVPADCPDRCEP
ncbi:bile acid:sodium symporter family protein [Methylococcus capsulatus]|jgi:BASS family bile acid:Na+ symporter|uniref:bile acid:sodium symporter family protein n=1 Tax=Methylococcus capsulatus TaxID=414 RepID=UPI001C52A8BB|nr:bile acid:sodium symporter family protein [Methylococcus capsulatus]QXP92778.1 bile acid:sodium symporter family protein [Methylococcus capsulatus]